MNVEPDRKYLFNNFVPESRYPTFSMYSELGVHPGAIGNTLFSLQLPKVQQGDPISTRMLCGG